MKRVILAGNFRQAQEFMREQVWNPRECIVVGVPFALRGVRGPVEVHRIGTYHSDRSAAFIEEVEQSLAVIEATS